MCYELYTLFTRICGISNNNLNSYSNAGSPNNARTPRNALINANECIPVLYLPLIPSHTLYTQPTEYIPLHISSISFFSPHLF